MMPQDFQKRGFVSLLTFAGFVIMSLTGLVLYIMPQGRVAYWVVWKFLGLTKTQWDSMHTISSILFLAAGIFHLVYNWNAFVSYIISKIQGGLRMKREMVLTGALTVLVIVSAVACLHLPIWWT